MTDQPAGMSEMLSNQGWTLGAEEADAGAIERDRAAPKAATADRSLWAMGTGFLRGRVYGSFRPKTWQPSRGQGHK